jgi:nicotinate-nucleotide adenylyltransferase
MKKIGLFFGTFNPIHVGHLIIANHMVEFSDLDQVWFVVSPHNPLKEKSSLLQDYHRLALVRAAVEENVNLKASREEFDLPQPSYTIHTLTHFKEKHPDHVFSLIMGEDNLRTFHKWRNYEQILETYPIYVYPRARTINEGEDNPFTLPEVLEKGHITLLDAPVMNISASFVRKAIGEGKSVKYLLSEPVEKYISEMHFYKK